MIISDLHIPFEDTRAVNITMKIHQHCRPETVIINGDMLDFVELSNFTRNKLDDRPITESIDSAIKLIKKLQKYSTVIYHIGNHEIRLQKYLFNNAPELAELISFNDLINNKLNTKIEFAEMVGRDCMKLYFNDKLLIGHLNRVSRYSAYTAKMLVEDYKINILQGHTHRLGMYYTTGAKETFVGVEGGCLCDIHPAYTHSPNWQNGFIMARDHQNMETIYINNGKTIYRGRVYKG